MIQQFCDRCMCRAATRAAAQAVAEHAAQQSGSNTRAGQLEAAAGHPQSTDRPPLAGAAESGPSESFAGSDSNHFVDTASDPGHTTSMDNLHTQDASGMLWTGPLTQVTLPIYDR